MLRRGQTEGESRIGSDPGLGACGACPVKERVGTHAVKQDGMGWWPRHDRAWSLPVLESGKSKTVVPAGVVSGKGSLSGPWMALLYPHMVRGQGSCLELPFQGH